MLIQYPLWGWVLAQPSLWGLNAGTVSCEVECWCSLLSEGWVLAQYSLRFSASADSPLRVDCWHNLSSEGWVLVQHSPWCWVLVQHLWRLSTSTVSSEAECWCRLPLRVECWHNLSPEGWVLVQYSFWHWVLVQPLLLLAQSVECSVLAVFPLRGEYWNSLLSEKHVLSIYSCNFTQGLLLPMWRLLLNLKTSEHASLQNMSAMMTIWKWERDWISWVSQISRSILWHMQTCHGTQTMWYFGSAVSCCFPGQSESSWNTTLHMFIIR